MAYGEQEIISFINNRFYTCLTLCKDEFSTYDAEDNNYIAEIKIRDKYYDTKMIEALKMFSNYQLSQKKSKGFIYIVKDPKAIYVFNINKIINTLVKDKIIALRCPETTIFGKNNKIIKYSYGLKESLAEKIIKL
jgi:hypothetical protein